MTQQHKQSGFTLIEVMVVVVILGILAAIVVPRVMSRPDEARIVKVQQDLRALSAALDLYKLDNFVYPSTDQGLQALVTRPDGLPQGARWKEGGYLDKVPTDPWGMDYQFLQPGESGTYDLYSLGADNAPGGEDVAADIGNWDLK
ncbi:MAG: type II secretion system major pseudopilin GspG [Gammaproteobacteria bacterium]|nr:type II secretion system major pseudopilin GspG [Gammaproteobacteria bacterium]